MSATDTWRANLKPVRFNFSGRKEDPVYDGLTDGTHWNGFINIWCTADVLSQITLDLHKMGDAWEGIETWRLSEVPGLVVLAGGYATQEVK